MGSFGIAEGECCHGKEKEEEEEEVCSKEVVKAGSEDERRLIEREFAHHCHGSGAGVKVARVNNGSFGICPVSVLAARERWCRRWLEQPDAFYFGPLQEGLLAARCAVASIIGVGPSPDHVVLLDNVTTAVAMVLQRVAWDFVEGCYQKGDTVLATDWSYGSVKKALKAYTLRAGAELIEVKMPFPVSSPEQIIEAFREVLDEAKQNGRRIRLAVIDHISSMPSVVLPIRELVRLCRGAGVDQIFVDGAHAIGSVEVDVGDINADYYSSNLHKWLFAPTSVAFLHCKEGVHTTHLHHPIVSHNYGTGLAQECEWVGTRDYSAELAATEAICFFDHFEGGITAVRDRNHRSAVEMAQMLASAWGTHLGAPPDMCSSMVMVGLPSALIVNSADDALNMRTRLRHEFHVEVPVYFDTPSYLRRSSSPPQSNTSCWAFVRISWQIYNEVNDYIKLRDAINYIVAETLKNYL